MYEISNKKSKLFKKCLLLFLVISFLLPEKITLASDGTSYVYDGYTYDYWWNAPDCPAMFELTTEINVNNLGGIKLQSVDDVCTSEDGRIFIVDALESRVNVLNETGTLLKSLKVIRDSSDKIVIDEDTGEQLILKNPEGAFVHEKNKELFIADTGEKRIVVLDRDTYSFKRIIETPKDLTGVTEFKPSKIAVDSADRIYVIVQSSYEGIIELNEDGTFSRFFGVNSPKVNIISQFWKALASDAQKSKMAKTYAPAFNNVAIDGEGFVMAVTFDSAAKDMVFRLSSSGKNVLREEGNTLVEGDIHSMNGEDTQFVDIAVTKYGTYALLDKGKGRIFLYDFDGQILGVMGSLGNVNGEFKTPTGIAWLGDKLVVTDSTLKCAYILAPTDFGRACLGASEKYYYGKWEEALTLFQEALRLNANYEIAYVGIGKNYLMKDDYKTAMYYFKLGNNKTFYSQAYNGYRSEELRDHFGIVAVVFVAFVTLIIGSEIRYYKKGGKRE